MAYMLFKYIRRRVKENNERKAAHNITDDSHLTPEFNPTEGLQSNRHESIPSAASTHHAQSRVEKPTPAEGTEESERFKAEARRMRAYRWRMIFGLILPNFLAAVDVTIVAPAIPAISSHFSM